MFKRFLGLVVLALLLVPPVFAGPFAWVLGGYDLTATSYTYCTSTSSSDTSPTCAALISSGWVNMPGGPASNRPIVAVIEWTTKNATSLDYSVECRSWGASIADPPLVVKQSSLSAVGMDAVVITDIPFDQCRIGLKLTSDTGAQVVNAYFASR